MSRIKQATAFNKALKSDNRLIRSSNRRYCKKVLDNPETSEEEAPPIRREISNPWNYD